ncbi:MAG: hypothetical protein H0W15_07955 [Gemmatimonadales bacterium]|nr:hypothetical protein [Gemmatimonadales bacterium]
MTRALLVLMLAGCSSLPGDADGVVSLELRSPVAVTLSQGASFTLQAQALDRNGEIVNAPIRWRTADTTITVDSVSGVVTALQGTGTGTVQAALGTLRGPDVVFTLQPAATGGAALD